MEYLDFELEIGPGTGRDYPVAVLHSPAGEARTVMHFPFDEPELKNHLYNLQLALLGSGSTRRHSKTREEKDAQEFGHALFVALFSGVIGARYAVSQDRAESTGCGLRVKLRIQPPEMQALPWEFLYDAQQAEYVCLSRLTPLVRYLELPKAVPSLRVTPPLRILGLVSSPSDLEPLDIEKEKAGVEQAIAALRDQGLVQLTWLPGQTWQDLQRAMRSGPWHILHFMGHGHFDSRGDEGLIALARQDGQSDFLQANQVGRLLADHSTLGLVLLNACQGARGGATNLFSSTAATLVRRGIPAVLAMQYDITVKAAVEFARAFYEALADRLPVDAAVSEARKAVSLEVTNTVEWGTPVLYMRATDGVLFDIATSRPAPALFQVHDTERLGPRHRDPQRVLDQIELESFVGREWLEEEVNQFLADHDSGYFVIEAEAGLGKTTFLAHLVQKWGCVHHFCGLTPKSQSSAVALKSITAQLALAFHLDLGAGEGFLPAASARPNTLHDVFVLASDARKPGQKIVLVIDALDQAETPKDANPLRLPDWLPQGVYIIASRRATSANFTVSDLTPHRWCSLAHDDASNERDVRRFLAEAAKRPAIAQALLESGYSSEQLIESLWEKSSGVWIYLHFVIREIEERKRNLDELGALPDGIVEYYVDSWQRERGRRKGEWERLCLPLLGALAASLEPATAEQLCGWAGLKSRITQAQRLLDEDWRYFISVTGRDDQRRYRFYHSTLNDFFAGVAEVPHKSRPHEGFIEQLRRASLAALWQIIEAPPAQEEKRRYALQMVHWKGISTTGEKAADNLLRVLELVARFVYLDTEREYLIECIGKVLAPTLNQPVTERQQARLLVYRAALYGNLGKVQDAASNYDQAAAIVSKWAASQVGEPEILELIARIMLGLGVNATRAAEELDADDSSVAGERERRLTRAVDLLTEAVDSAKSYGRDTALTAIALKELCWAYDLVPDWPRAEQAYQEALRLLKTEPDVELRTSYQARVLEMAGTMHVDRGRALESTPSEALLEYLQALRLVEAQIAILERTGPSLHLINAHFNWSEYALAADNAAQGSIPSHLPQACDHWRAAQHMARRLGLPGEQQDASELLQEHCV